MLPKDEDFSERTRHIAVQGANMMSRSADFSTAQTLSATSAPGFKGFDVTITSDYAVGILDSLTIERGKSNKAALVDALDNCIKGCLEEIGNSKSVDLYRNGTGALAQAKASGAFSTTSLTLLNIEDVDNFEVGMELVFAATATGALRNSGASATVTAINRDTGVLTSDSNWTSQVAAAADSDYIFCKGDAPNNTGTNVKLTGLGGWIPFTAPSASESFFGADRSTDTERYAGFRHDGSGGSAVKDELLKLLTKMYRGTNKRARPDHIFMNPIDLQSLLLDIESQHSYQKVDSTNANVFYEAVTFMSPFGQLKVFADKYCPEKYAWALDLRTWKLASLGKMPRIIQNDGLETLRQSSADGVEFRAVARAQLYTTAPAFNGVVKFP
jgi:Family of unknown function (DUF5309)